MSSRLRSLVALSLSLALGAMGCSKDGEPESEAKTEPEAKAESKAESETKPQTEPELAKGGDGGNSKASAPPTHSPGALAAAVESILEAEVHYPTELDPLLDLVPAGADQVLVVRDVEDLLAMADATMGAVGPGFRSFAAAIGGDASADVDKAFTGYEALQAGLRGVDFTIDKGLVVANMGEDAVVIYGASKPNALPLLFSALGASGDDMPDECGPVEGAAGYVVCAARPEVLAKYAPGKEAAAVRSQLAEHLDAKDIERANVVVVANKSKKPGEHIKFTLATSPGLAHFTLGLDEVPGDLGKTLGSGGSPALGLVAPGSGFYWFKADPEVIAERTKDQQFMVRNVLGTLTGEVLLGMTESPRSFVALAGVDDPGPALGLIAMAGMVTDKIPKTLPDGSSIDVGVETIMEGSKATQVLHASMKPAGPGAELFKSMGLVPEAWVFSVGGYAGVAFGSDQSVVEAIASYGGGVMSPQAAKALPKPLAQNLVDGRVSMAMHLPIDGLQSPAVSESFQTVAKSLPPGDLPSGTTPGQIMTLAQSIMAPLSSISMWMAPPTDRITVHMAISLLGDPRTEQGKAELEAMTTIAGGGDAATVYGELATRFPDSGRALAYQARAGTRSDGALTSAAMLGVMAAVAIPAFVKYQQRSKAVTAEAEAAKAAAEAAAAKAAAEAAEAAK